MKKLVLSAACVFIYGFAFAQSKSFDDLAEAEKVCLGYGLVAKAAGEQRDSGVEKAQAIEKIIDSSGNKDPAQVAAGRKYVEQAVLLAYSNRALTPWTLHALNANLCVIQTRWGMNAQIREAAIEFAGICQSQNKEAQMVNSCMKEFVSVMAASADRAKSK